MTGNNAPNALRRLRETRCDNDSQVSYMHLQWLPENDPVLKMLSLRKKRLCEKGIGRMTVYNNLLSTITKGIACYFQEQQEAAKRVTTPSERDIASPQIASPNPFPTCIFLNDILLIRISVR